MNTSAAPFRCFTRCILAAVAVAACDAAEAVDIQPLPPLERASPEARLGLPEVAGEWRFAGWEFPGMAPDAESGVEPPSPAAPGTFIIRTQRLDSLSGEYLFGGTRFPITGEVRRDSVLSLVAAAPGVGPSFAAGRVLRDTLWVELTSFGVAESWPDGTRAAFVRSAGGAPFLRYAAQLPAASGGVTAGTVPTENGEAVTAESEFVPAPPPAAETPARATPTTPPVQREPAAVPPPQTPPAPSRPTPLPIPAPEIREPAPPRQLPRRRGAEPILPGVPVVPARPDTGAGNR